MPSPVEDYFADVNTYLAASDAGSTVASWNTTGNTSVMWLASFLTAQGSCTFCVAVLPS